MSYEDLRDLSNKRFFDDQQYDGQFRAWVTVCGGEVAVKDMQNPSAKDKAVMATINIQREKATNLYHHIMEIADYFSALADSLKDACVKGDEDNANLGVLKAKIDLSRAMMSSSVAIAKMAYEEVKMTHEVLNDPSETDPARRGSAFGALTDCVDVLSMCASGVREAAGLSGPRIENPYYKVDTERVASYVREAEKLLKKYGLKVPVAEISQEPEEN